MADCSIIWVGFKIEVTLYFYSLSVDTVHVISTFSAACQQSLIDIINNLPLKLPIKENNLSVDKQPENIC